MKKLIFKIRFSPGDILMFTAALRDLHKAYPGEYLTDIRSPAGEIFENNPYLTPIKDGQADHELMIQYEMIHESGWNGQHFSEGFRLDLSERLGLIEYMQNPAIGDEKKHIKNYLSMGTTTNLNAITFVKSLVKEKAIAKPIPATGIRPEIFLSDDEKTWVNQVAVEFGYTGDFWVINAGWKDDFPLKKYPYWQEVADILSKDVQLVQVGHSNHNHPKLKGVLNLVGKTGLRQLMRLFWHAKGGLGVVSFPMVTMAAFGKPYVCVAGGRESPRWQSYPDHAFLNVNGFMDCCNYDGCWRSKLEECTNIAGGIPKCMQIITPEEVAEATIRYYKGGRLKF